MKKLTITTALTLIISLAFSQTVFKGLNYHMRPGEAKNEFKKNKLEYDNVDFGNGFVWRIYQQNFMYDEIGLVGVLFSPKGAALGLSHDGATSYLEFSRAFFENKGYTVFFEPDYWQYPINFKAKYGLLMHDAEKKIVVQLYPYKGYSGTNWFYSAYMKVMNYDWFMNDFNNQTKILQEKSNNSGF